MAEITVKRHIQAPPERVFSLATDIENFPVHLRGVTKVELLTPGPVGRGTRFRETRLMFKREATEEMELTAFDPPSSYQVGCENHGCRYHTEVRFTPNGAGTDVEMRFAATPLTWVAKLMSFAMKPMVKSVSRCLEQDLDDLKSASEGSPGRVTRSDAARLQ